MSRVILLANEFELELREERIISGIGSLRVPDVATIRYARLNIDVVRMVTEPHLSKKFTPNRSRFCTLSFMKNGYVIAEEVVDYRRRQFDWQPGLWHQNLAGIQCSYEGLLQSFFNLGVALQLQPVTKENDVAPWRPINTFWDEVQVTCEGTTAVQLRLYIQALEDCDGQDDNIPDEPPPPDLPEPLIPPFFPIEVSPPYDPDDPDEPYAPIPTDSLPEPPNPFPQEPCQRYEVRVRRYDDGIAGSVSIFSNVRAPFRCFPVSDDPNFSIDTNPGGAIGLESSSCSGDTVTSEYGSSSLIVSGGTAIRRCEITRVTPV